MAILMISMFVAGGEEELKWRNLIISLLPRISTHKNASTSLQLNYSRQQNLFFRSAGFGNSGEVKETLLREAEERKLGEEKEKHILIP